MKPYEDAYPEVFLTVEEYELSEEAKAEIAMQRLDDVD